MGGGYFRKLRYPIILILVVGTSFLMFHNSQKEQILKAKQEENTLAIYLEDEPINYIPEKDSGYTLDLSKSSCNNGVTISFDYNTWSVKTNYSNYTNQDNTRVKCSLYFKKRTFAESLVDCGSLSKDAGVCIKENYYLTDEIVDDETIDNNLRFIGSDPANYVWFNNELWRIIGVFNNIDDGTGKKETRLKIIRDESIGSYSWDNKANGVGSSTSVYGSNDWSDSALQIVLNSGAYYNRTSGNCPYGQNGATTACDFSEIGLTNEAKSMISNAVWNLGGLSTTNNAINFFQLSLISDWYKYERGVSVYNDRATKWIGKVGLMYSSDYGYATNGGTSQNRVRCMSIPLYNWLEYLDDTNYCVNNNWLFKIDLHQWTLVPISDGVASAFFIVSSGSVTSDSTITRDTTVSPVVYLKSSIKITSGMGTKESPYHLSL